MLACLKISLNNVSLSCKYSLFSMVMMRISSSTVDLDPMCLRMLTVWLESSKNLLRNCMTGCLLFECACSVGRWALCRSRRWGYSSSGRRNMRGWVRLGQDTIFCWWTPFPPLPSLLWFSSWAEAQPQILRTTTPLRFLQLLTTLASLHYLLPYLRRHPHPPPLAHYPHYLHPLTALPTAPH